MKIKKLVAMLATAAMAVGLVAVAPTEAKAADEYYVAGVAGLCGVEWKENAAQNKMTAGANGMYSITYDDIAAGEYGFKITDGTWTNAWGKDGNNYIITLNKTADVTIKFNSSTKEITVESEGLTATVFTVNSITVVGEGTEGFNVDWTPGNAANHMTNNNGVWSITYTGVKAGECKFKFAVNDDWGHQFSADAALENDTKVTANHSSNASNTTITVAKDDSTVKVYLDLSNLNADDFTGAQTWVVIEEPSAGNGGAGNGDAGNGGAGNGGAGNGGAGNGGAGNGGNNTPDTADVAPVAAMLAVAALAAVVVLKKRTVNE